jgi:hypothetical protein
MITRAQVIEAARDWVDTPFQHQGRVKGRAVDCVGLVLCVCEELGAAGASLTPESWTRLPQYTNYGPMPFQRQVFDECMRRLIKRPWKDGFKPGDVLSLRVPTEPCHVAIVSGVNGVPYMIHAYGGSRMKCSEHVLDVKWQNRIAGVFTIPGVED